MKTIALDSQNNIIATQNFQILSGNDALIQDIKNRISMFIKEYPFDINEGIDYIGLMSANRRADLQNAIIKEILKDNRVKSVSAKNLQFINNRLNLDITITSKTGDVLYV